jgi:hypothetical protein
MYKMQKLEPSPDIMDNIDVYPHSDCRVLHAPGECVECDLFPIFQALRFAWDIAYTGYTPENKELPCPFDYGKGEPYLNTYCNCIHATAAWRCRRGKNHPGPCAAVPDFGI